MFYTNWSSRSGGHNATSHAQFGPVAAKEIRAQERVLIGARAATSTVKKKNHQPRAKDFTQKMKKKCPPVFRRTVGERKKWAQIGGERTMALFVLHLN